MRRWFTGRSVASRFNLCLLPATCVLISGVAVGGPPGEGSGRRGPDGPRGPRGPQGPPPHGPMMPASPLLKVLDADADGTISDLEIANAAARLKTLDTNGDGAITREELVPTRGGPVGGRRDVEGRRGEGRGGEGRGGRRGKLGGGSGEIMAKVFEHQDADGDGKLSGDEIPERLKRHLDRVDTDGDGSISREEMKMVGEKMRGGRGKSKGDKRRGAEDLGTPGGDLPRKPSDT